MPLATRGDRIIFINMRQAKSPAAVLYAIEHRVHDGEHRRQIRRSQSEVSERNCH